MSLVLNYFKLTLPAFFLSSLIFIFFYNKVGIFKLLGNKPRLIIFSIIIVFLFYIAGISITDKFANTRKYHDLFVGLFLGPTLGILLYLAKYYQNINK